jgi:hypothetical protein
MTRNIKNNEMMKKIFFVLFFIAICNNSYSIGSLKEIKDSIFFFLKRNEVMSLTYKPEYISNSCFINATTHLAIKEGEIGVFILTTFSAHNYDHFILIDNNNYFIINMRDPFEKNIKQLVDFLKLNNLYKKEDVILYVNEFIRIKHQNDKLNNGL